MPNQISHTQDHELSHSMAHYLLTIHKLKESKGYARVTDIAKDLGLTKGSVSTAQDELLGSGDKDLIAFAQGGVARKLLSTYVPFLDKGIGSPINAFFNVLVRTGRTSCSKPNLQNLPRSYGIREAFVPRPNMTFCTVDYDTIELRALAQVHLNWFGSSSLADAFVNGEDPHLSLAAYFLKLPY